MKKCPSISAAASIFLVGLFLISGVANGDNGYDPNDPDRKDTRTFTTNTLVKVYLNYSSFESHDFPDSFTQEALERAIKTSIDRWVQLSSFRLRVEYRGVDNSKNSPGDREIVIRANKSHPKNWLGSADTYGGFSNKGLIYFYREDASRILHNWKVFPEEDLVGCNFLTILLHEMGHIFGLQHNDDPTAQYNTVMHTYTQPMDHYGPYDEDIEDLIDMYGKRNSLVVKVKRSTDDGRSWSDLSSNMNSKIADTTLPIVVNRDSDRMIAFYTRHDKKPVWVIGDTNAQNWNTGSIFGVESSFYGTTGHGYDDEYMMAWVDHTDGHKIKMVRSADGGETWYWRNPPTSRAVGTPSVHKVAGSTWVLAYPASDISYPRHGGRILTRVSTDDGASWGPAVELFSGEEYRSLGGVSVSSDGTSQVRISFAHSTNKIHKGMIRTGSIVTINAHVDDDRLQQEYASYDTGVTTLNGPMLTKSSNKFFMGYKGINNELIVRTTNSDSRWWSDKVIVSNDQLINPTVSAIRNTNYAYFFYQDD